MQSVKSPYNFVALMYFVFHELLSISKIQCYVLPRIKTYFFKQQIMHWRVFSRFNRLPHYCLQILLTKLLGCTLCLFVLSILLTFKLVCGFYAPKIEHYSFLSNAPKIIYYAFKKMPIISKIIPLIMQVYSCVRPLS